MLFETNIKDVTGDGEDEPKTFLLTISGLSFSNHQLFFVFILGLLGKIPEFETISKDGEFFCVEIGKCNVSLHYDGYNGFSIEIYEFDGDGWLNFIIEKLPVITKILENFK